MGGERPMEMGGGRWGGEEFRVAWLFEEGVQRHSKSILDVAFW